MWANKKGLKSLMVCVLVGWIGIAFAQPITFLFHPDYYPLTFEEDGKAKGLIVDVANEIAKELGESILWESSAVGDALVKLQRGGFFGMPSLVFTPERKDDYQWVGPIAKNMTYLYAPSDRDLSITSLEEAKKLGSVGVVQNYYSHQILKSKGFTNLVIFESERELLQDLLNGELDLAPFNSIVLLSLLGEEASNQLRPKIPLNLEINFLGLSKDIPKTRIAEWQDGLDGLKRSGEFALIYQKWLPDHPVPGVFTLLTEEYPPVTYMGEDGQLKGYVVELIESWLEETGSLEETLLVPWSVGYELALHLPNVILFSMDRTPIRESLFHWIGPVGRNTAYLYAQSDHAFENVSLDMAKTVSAIATTENWWTQQLLKSLGFTNLTSSLNPLDNVSQLIEGQVDMAIFTDVTVGSLVSDAGYHIQQITPVLEVLTQDYYIAASKGTDLAIVYSLQRSIDQMKRDGRLEKTFRKYFPHILISPILWESSTPSVSELSWSQNLLKPEELAKVTLWENASTGYVWDYTISNPDVVELVDQQAQTKEEDGMRLGSGYAFEWVFQAKEPGESVILFNLSRPWETEHPIKTLAITIRVE